MYKYLREYGILTSLIVHWFLYYFALFNIIMDYGFDGKINFVMQIGSMPLLGIGVALTFKKCMDDCNVKFLDAAIFSFLLRFVIIALLPWGLESGYDIMIFCGIATVLYFVFVKMYRPNKYFNH